jgi:LEA14-like dessication related protein
VNLEKDMLARRASLIVLLAIVPWFFDACASLQGKDPLQVTVAGVEPLQGQGLEMRMMVKLRVQNPNDAPINYNGVSLTMDVQGKSFASGVSDGTGTVPRYGEAVIDVPVTISAFRMIRQAMGMMQGTGSGGKLSYEMKGKLGGSGTRFSTKGDFEMPTSTATAAEP